MQIYHIAIALQLEELFQATVLMETSGLLGDRLIMKDGLRSASTEYGVPCVMEVMATDGTQMMVLLFVANSGIKHEVILA